MRTEVVVETVQPLSSNTPQETVIAPAGAPATESLAAASSLLIDPAGCVAGHLLRLSEYI
jgi:hypothetical protein